MTVIGTADAPAGWGVELLPVASGRWRVVDRTGRVIGHVRTQARADGVRFHAERFERASGRFRSQGAFWCVREAVECLRYLR